MGGGYPQSLIENLLSEIKFTKESRKETIAIRDTMPGLN